MALNPTTCPAVGCATATLPDGPETTMAPPTGTRSSATRLGPAAPDASDDDGETADEPAEPLPPPVAEVEDADLASLPHAASVPRPALLMTAATTTVRRSGVASGCMGGTIASGSVGDGRAGDGPGRRTGDAGGGAGDRRVHGARRGRHLGRGGGTGPVRRPRGRRAHEPRPHIGRPR